MADDAASLFGKPSPRFMGFINEPDVVVGFAATRSVVLNDLD